MADETKVSETHQTKEVKFTDDEMQSLQSLQNGYQEKQTILGQLSVQRIRLNQQQEALEARIT